MDVGIEPILLLPTGAALPPWGDAKARVTFVTGDPWPVGARAKTTAERCPGASANDLEIPSKFKKDVNLDGTNSTSPLESKKLSKKRTQNEVKITPKNVRRVRKSD